jgi:hypothetical protein
VKRDYTFMDQQNGEIVTVEAESNEDAQRLLAAKNGAPIAVDGATVTPASDIAEMVTQMRHELDPHVEPIVRSWFDDGPLGEFWTTEIEPMVSNGPHGVGAARAAALAIGQALEERFVLWAFQRLEIQS